MHLTYGPELLGAEMGVFILPLEKELCPVTFGLQKKRKGLEGVRKRDKSHASGHQPSSLGCWMMSGDTGGPGTSIRTGIGAVVGSQSISVGSSDEYPSSRSLLEE